VTDPDWDAPLRRITRANVAPDHTYAATITAETAADSTAYLHIVIRLSDYISVPQLAVTGGGTRDSAWIEGGVKIDGTTLAVTFNRAVTPDGQAAIEFRNEYSIEDRWDNQHGFCSSIDSETFFALTYFQEGGIAPTSEPGDAAMMRRLLEAREHDHVAQQSAFSGLYSSGNGVFPCLNTYGGYIGCRYENRTSSPAWHRYELHGLFFARSTYSGNEIVSGLSFDTAIPSIPAGETVRIAMYAHDGPVPPVAMLDGDRIIPNIISVASASDYDVVSGAATIIKLANGSHEVMTSDDASLDYPLYDATVVPLGHYDIPGGSGLAQDTLIPFASHYTLPRCVTIFVAINVINYSADWVAAPTQHTAVQFNPSDIKLHVV